MTFSLSNINNPLWQHDFRFAKPLFDMEKFWACASTWVSIRRMVQLKKKNLKCLNIYEKNAHEMYLATIICIVGKLVK